MKILIVDDEAMIRIGMRTIIPWEKHGYHIVGEAINGMEALNLVRVFQPDIILVDIVMPGMDGLDLIRVVHKELPFCKFIILSCRDDLDYYKTAISLGVSDYILKNSVSLEGILDTVDRVAEQIRRERIFDIDDDKGKSHVNHHLVLTEFLNMVLRGEIRNPVQVRSKLGFLSNSFTSGQYLVLVFSAEYSETGEKYNGSLDYSIIGFGQEIINDIGKGYIFKSFQDRIVAIVVCPDGLREDNLIEMLCRSICETIKQCLDITLTIGASERLYDFGLLQEGYNQAVTALDKQFFHGFGKIYYFNSHRENSKELLERIEKEKQIIFNIWSPFEINSITASVQNITKYLSESDSIGIYQARIIYTDILYHIIELLRKNDININELVSENFCTVKYLEKLRSIWELNESVLNLLDRIKFGYGMKYQKKQFALINMMKRYIEDNINKRISLDGISRTVYLNPTYVSKLFKKETGENIRDYILKAKVEKSKGMLHCDRDMSEITESLGFSSISHFIRVFKSVTGITPGQYNKISR
jgi:two-component system, response regulator YesN